MLPARKTQSDERQGDDCWPLLFLLLFVSLLLLLLRASSSFYFLILAFYQQTGPKLVIRLVQRHRFYLEEWDSDLSLSPFLVSRG